LVKRILFALLQFFAFCALFMVGGYWDIVRLLIELRLPSLNVIPLWKISNITATHDLVANGIVFAAVLLVILLVWQAVRKTLRTSAPLTLVAFAAAALICFACKVGLPPAAS
jgi:hypothetical protein